MAKKYRIILVDPPWPVKKILRKVRPNQVEMDYPTMTLEEIKALPVQAIADDKSMLFLWTINKFLPDAFDVVKEWGFRFQRLLTWDKGNGLCLFGFHLRTEFCLVGTRGRWEIYPSQKAIPTLIVEHTWRQHSKKPEIMYKYLEQFGGPRIELFARQKVEGWDSVGYDIDGCDIRETLTNVEI